ncbi:MAG TPA: glycosyltransferase [Phycisphaerales bacterium]|nr:glycosyltransferase [Phycisphaerales bacterium]
MLRVAHVIERAEAGAGGTATALLSILDALATLDGRVESTSYFPRPKEDDVVWARIKRDPQRYVLAESVGRIVRPGNLGLRVAADLHAGKVDVVHLHGLWSPDLVHAARTAQRLGIATLWQSHGMLLHAAMDYKKLKKQVFLRLGLGRALRRASGFITETVDGLHNSAYPASIPMERRFLVGYPIILPEAIPDRTALRPVGRTRFGIPDDAFTFAFLGRLHPIKRVDMTIEAFARAAANDQRFRLLLLGTGEVGYVGKLKRRAEALKVADRVVFAGWISNEEKLQGLAASDAFVLNSRLESFGYVLFEAISRGTPPVVTENLSLAGELTREGAAVRTRNSVEGLAEGLRQMAEHSAGEREAMAQRGFAWAKEEYDPARIGLLLEETYAAVCGRGGRPDGAIRHDAARRTAPAMR